MRNGNSPKIFEKRIFNHEVVDAIQCAEPVDFYGFVEAVMVTPEIAEIFLQYNTANRHVSDVVNQRYARIMKAGDWRFNGQTIVFSDKGRLIDGQNRLKAIVRSGQTMPMLIVYGIRDENFRTMDQGCKRTTGQVLNILDCKNGNLLAAALRLAYIYCDVNSNLNCSIAAYVYNEALLNFFKRHPEIEKSVEFVGSYNGLCSPSALAFCHFIFAQKCLRSADLFMQQLMTGENLHAGHPVLALRNRLYKNKDSRVKLSCRELIILIFKTWNFCRNFQEIKHLNVGSADTLPEVI